ncbi:MAG: cadherin repeat domain-containing protein, partial [Erysipelotrichaceae bacterium]|nr:cadherin repeat domain-containing protein [Erysipelotrichaceae bacterium]
MWKKALFALMALIGTVSGVYAYYNVKMEAATSIGGKVHGKFGAPGIGDRVYLGTKSNLGTNVGWVLVADYSFNNSYLAFSTSSIGRTTLYSSVSDIPTVCHQIDPAKTALWKNFDTFNGRLSSNTQDMKVVAERSAQWYKSFAQSPALQNFINNANYGLPALQNMNVGVYDPGSTIASSYRNQASLVVILRNNFVHSGYGISNTGGTYAGSKVAFPYTGQVELANSAMFGAGVPNAALAAHTPVPSGAYSLNVDGKQYSTFVGNFWSGVFLEQAKFDTQRNFFTYDGPNGSGGNAVGTHNLGSYQNPVLGYTADIQGAIELNKSIINQKVLFSMSMPTTTGSGFVEVESAVAGFGRYQTDENMKMRLVDPGMWVRFEDIFYNNESIYTKQKLSKGSTAKVEKDASIQLKVDGNSGSNSYGINTISAFISTPSGKMLYMPLGDTGSTYYTLDLKSLGLEIGTYSVKVVNENYSDTEVTPANCSEFSDSFQFEVVDPLTITYQGTQQTYTFNQNVNKGNTVGTVTFKDGVKPYHVVFDTSEGQDYQNFSFSSDQNITGSSVSVIVNQNAPKTTGQSLNAGTYKFCIIGYDLYDMPSPAEIGKSKVCAELTVDKANLSVAFDDPSTTKKSVAEAATPWNEIAKATPDAGVKITYTKIGGDIGLIDIDPDTGQITYTGNVAFGKVKIRATADDDPTTGNDNYESATADKEIIIAQDIEGVVTPDTNSSDPNIPTFTATDTNVQTGGTIGKVQGTQGTPDNLKSGTITYTYGLKSDGDGNLFSVNAVTGEIKSNADLSTGVYNITVTITDKWNPKPKDIPVTINVGVA